MASEITVASREAEIVQFLKGLETGSAHVRGIYEHVTAALGDTVSIQAYYKIIQRMVDSGRLVEAQEHPELGKFYAVAPYLNVDNPKTLDDIYEIMSLMSPADALAHSIDALDYYAEKQESTLKKAAEALMDENPLDVFFGFVDHSVSLFQQDLALYRDEAIRDARLESRLQQQLQELELLVYRGLSLPLDAIDITTAHNFQSESCRIHYDRDKVREILKTRIIGDRFIAEVDVTASRNQPNRLKMSVAGSDGSIHAGVLGTTTARDYTDDFDQDFITFNNSVAYVEQSKNTKKPIQYPYHCVPMNRSTLENPANRGMVLTRQMFPDLSESQYEHMAKCASDVVQLRVDSAIFLGTARASMGTGELLPEPIVHIRDGTVTPQEREFKHYRQNNSYGDMVREGLREHRKIVEKVTSAKTHKVFSGAVKSTVVKVFVRAVNWYIVFGSKKRFGAPIDATWDLTRAARIADNAAMTFLLAALPNRAKEGKYWTTCVVLRRYHSLTEYYAPRRAPGLPEAFPDAGWADYFKRISERDAEFYRVHGGEPPYFENVGVDDDAFVYMCDSADYATFYIGYGGGGEPPPLVPRYEFVDNLRRLSGDALAQRVAGSVRLIVEAIDETKLSFDKEHNYLTNKRLIKVVPYVTYMAHEQSKSIGRQLQSELKAIVVARLIELKRLRLPKGANTKILPVSVQKYVERYYDAIKDEIGRDPGKYVR